MAALRRKKIKNGSKLDKSIKKSEITVKGFQIFILHNLLFILITLLIPDNEE
ncbi:Uncharacterised protein [uncultured Eubacterium sp.]|nr:Uncharacterised protein [uncultured Eubacterium sp.]